MRCKCTEICQNVLIAEWNNVGMCCKSQIRDQKVASWTCNGVRPSAEGLGWFFLLEPVIRYDRSTVRDEQINHDKWKPEHTKYRSESSLQQGDRTDMMTGLLKNLYTENHMLSLYMIYHTNITWAQWTSLNDSLTPELRRSKRICQESSTEDTPQVVPD